MADPPTTTFATEADGMLAMNPAAATSHGDDFRLQWRRFQFGDFSGGDFSDHGEFSNMGLKATKRTTIRWDDGMPSFHGPRLLQVEAVGTVDTTRSAPS
jgi:hypothetical protein